MSRTLRSSRNIRLSLPPDSELFDLRPTCPDQGMALTRRIQVASFVRLDVEYFDQVDGRISKLISMQNIDLVVPLKLYYHLSLALTGRKHCRLTFTRA